jgi:Protein of unknown function, DUF547
MKFSQKVIFLSYMLLLITSCNACFSVKTVRSDSKPILHDLWDTLLKKHVSAAGVVNYKGFIADSVAFQAYLKLLSQGYPNDKNWTKNEQIAYWINTYNAYTVQLILKNYPVKSIKSIKSGIPFVNDVWQMAFIPIENQWYHLNNIEHGILRTQFQEPRIHFVVNCASKSCPKLLNEAYTAENIEMQLSQQARAFINDGVRNKISAQKAELSKIFSWYRGDFTKKQTLYAFINQYADVKMTENMSIDYLDYDWNLNE